MFYKKSEFFQNLEERDWFDYFWALPELWVEPPNVRRNGKSGVIRSQLDDVSIFVKKQVGHIHRSLMHPFGRPTALREFDMLRALECAGVSAPKPIFCASKKINGEHRTLLITEGLVGYETLDVYQQSKGNALNETEYEQLIEAVSSLLAKLHHARFRHGALYAKHVFVRQHPTGFDAALLDLEKARKLRSADKVSEHGVQQFKRHHTGWSESHWQRFDELYEKTYLGLKNGK